MSYAVIAEYDRDEYPSMPQFDVEWSLSDEDEASDLVEEMREENGPDNTRYTIVEVIQRPVFGVN